jgi:hypothetical protein
MIKIVAVAIYSKVCLDTGIGVLLWWGPGYEHANDATKQQADAGIQSANTSIRGLFAYKISIKTHQ